MLDRLRSLPLPAHAATIGVVLLLLLPWLDHGIYSADEGALLAQVDQIEQVDEWVVPNPSPVIDPELDALPLELAYRSTDGHWAPFHKNAVFVGVVAASRSIAGDVGPLLLSVAATVAAAVAAGVLARRLAPGTEVAALWLAALGSPLLFDGYLYMAHAAAAATSGLAAVAAVVAVERRRHRLLPAVVATALAVLGAFLRAEAVLFAVALGGAVAIAGLLRPATAPHDGADARPRWRPDVAAVAFGLGLALAGLVARFVVPAVDSRFWPGDPLPTILAGQRNRPDWLAGRLDGFVNTWLRPATGSSLPPLLVLPVVGVVLLAAAVLVSRRRSASRADGPGDLPALLAVGGAALVAVRLLEGPAVVPGLLVAFPALVGVLALDRWQLRRPVGTIAAAGAGLFALAVLATQYPEGGVAEWGGRYFALGIPLAVPLAVAGLARLKGAVPRRVGHVVVGSVVVASLVLAVGAVTSLRQAKDRSVTAVARFEELRREVGRDGAPAPVLTTSGAMGRFAWEGIDEGGWYTVARTDLVRYAARLARSEPVVLVLLADPAAELPLLEGEVDVEPISGSANCFRLLGDGDGADRSS